MGFCPKCGQRIGEGNVFCSRCGTRVESSETKNFSKNEPKIIKKECPICGGKGRIKGRSLLDQNVKCPVCENGINKFELSEEENLVKCTNCRDGWVKAASINVQKEFCDTCRGKGWIVR